MTPPARDDQWRQSIVQLKRGFAAANRVEVGRGEILSAAASRTAAPAVSFVMVVRGGAPLLAQSLSSLQQQDVRDWECIVVDDGALDYSLDVARLFAQADDRFTVVWNPEPVGLAAAANSGVRLARGERVAFVDPAAIHFPGALAAHLSAPAADGTYCDWRRISRAAVPQVPQSRPRRRQQVPTVAAALDQGCPSAAIVVRRDVLDAAPLDEAAAQPLADLWGRLEQRGATFSYVAHIGVGHRSAADAGDPVLPAVPAEAGAPGGAAAGRVLPRHVAVAGPGTSVPDGTVLLVPQVRYHVDELGPLAQQLRARGTPVAFMPTAVQGRLGEALRQQVLTELSKYTDTVLAWDAALPGRSRLGGVVVLNDWGSTKELVVAAQAAGTPTFAKVEGVQDFADRDTGRARSPYRTADVVLAQGPNDARALDGAEVHVVGNARLERALGGARSRRRPLVAVNLNFTYDVLVERANDWLAGVLQACETAQVEAVVCPHPAQLGEHLDRSLIAGRTATQPLRAVLLDAGLLVTRFSTVLYEAIARGVPVAYHNPHGEQAWQGQLEPGPALPMTTSADQLANAIVELLDDPADPRIALQPVFAAQVDVSYERHSPARTADVISERLT